MHTFQEALRDQGVALASFQDLRDHKVITAIASHSDLSRRFQHALQNTRNPGTIAPLRPKSPSQRIWPAEIRRHFKLPARFHPWSTLPDDFNWEEALREHSRQQRGGRLAYAPSLEKKEQLKTAMLEEKACAKRIGPLDEEYGLAQIIKWLEIISIPQNRYPFAIFPPLLGFKAVKDEPMAPGDLMIFGDILVGAAVLTQVDYHIDPAEILLPWGKSLYLTDPENADNKRLFFRLEPSQKPDYLIVESLIPEQEKALPVDTKNPLYRALEVLDFERRKFRILQRTISGDSVGRGLMVDFSLANGDWACFHIDLHGSGPSRHLSVVIDYQKSIGSDPPDFVRAAERALRFAARYLGANQLSISYKLISLHHDPAFKAELALQGYSKQKSVGWGSLPGKRLTL